MLSLSRRFTSMMTTNPHLILSTVAPYSTTSKLESSQLEMPKRPKTAFFLFRDKEIPSLTASAPNKKPTELAPILAQKWSQLSDAEKQAYQEQYLKDMDEYKGKIAAIVADPKLNEQLITLKQGESKKRAEKAIRKARKAKSLLLKDLGRPKKPLSPYLLFFSEKWPVHHTKSGQVTDTTKVISELWKSLSEGEKTEYKAKFNNLQEEYKVELEAWKLKVQDDDNYESIAKVQKKLTNATKRKKRLNE